MAAIDVMTRIRQVAIAAINEQCFGEDIGFDAQLVINPGPPPGAGYMLVFTKVNPLLGQGPLGQVLMLSTPLPSDADIERAVSSAVRDLGTQSRKILAGANAGSNGSPAARPAPA